MSNSSFQRFAQAILLFIAFVQAILGIVFLVSPAAFAAAMGLAAAPAWTEWIFAMFGARALGFAFGMVVAQRDIARHRSWLVAMIGVQALDWIGTLWALAQNKVSLGQVATAPFLPILFVIVLAAALRAIPSPRTVA